MDAREKKIVYLASAMHATVHMQMLAFAAVNILMAHELGASITAIGFVGTLSYFLFGLGALPAGFVSDAVGARRVLAICAAGLAVANLVLAFSPDPFWAMAGLGLMGLSGSVYHPAGLGLISRNVRQTGLAMGIHGTFGNIGLAMGPLIAGFVAAAFGWRWAYLWTAVPLALLSFIFFTTRFRDVGEDHKHLQPDPPKRFAKGLLLMLLVVIVLQSLSGFIYRSSITFMPAHAAQVVGGWFSGLDPTSRGGLLTGIIFLTGAVGQFLAGTLSAKIRTETLQFVIAIAVVPLLAGLGAFTGMPMLGTGMAYAFFFFGMQPLGNALVAKYSPEGLRGRSYGFSFFLSFGIGAFGSGFAGFVGETQGFGSLYLWLALIACLSAALAAVILALAVRRGRRMDAREKLLAAQV
ncbi:MAG TPA: MFS transporter [Acidobacteriota bacterium]|nr:MFS transporter [Acidobacteriota bacterium]